MNELVSKYGIVALLAGVLILALLSRRGGGGGSVTPDYNNVTTGIDTAYEALKFDAEKTRVQVAGQAFADLVGRDVAIAKLGTDERIAGLESGAAVEIARETGITSRYQADAVRRIADITSAADVRRADAEAAALARASDNARRAATSQARWGALGDLGSGFLSLFGF